MPSRSRSSRDMPECEVVAGRVIRVSTPPRLGAQIASLTLAIKRSAASIPPASLKLKTPPNPSNSSRAR